VNVNPLDVIFIAFVDLKFQIHRTGVHVRNAHRLEAGTLLHVNIALAAVKILDRLQILVESVGCENITRIHRQSVWPDFALGALKAMHLLQPLVNLLSLKSLLPLNLTEPTLYCLPSKIKNGCPSCWARIHEFHVLDFKIEVTVAAVKFHERVLVILKLVLFEHPAARQPGKHPVPPGLDLLAQLPLGKCRRADKFNFDNFDLRASVI
jgi:hypothetical protein